MSTIKFDSIETKASYGIGRQMGRQIVENTFPNISFEAVIAGIEDSFNNKKLAISADEIQEAFQTLNERLEEEQKKQNEGLIKGGEEFLAENAKRSDVTVLESGLQYEILEAAAEDATKPSADDTVRTHYKGTLVDGTQFDSSYDRSQPAEFPVGGVISGWTEALQLMGKGAKWKLYIPYNLAYGAQGSPGGIPAYAALVFEVELLDII